METKDIILELRTKKGLSQDELAKKVMVPRQAGSVGFSNNTLLGAPRQLICQCCGMPLNDEIIGYNSDGTMNENYCKWCYADGIYTYESMSELIDVCVKNMVNESITEEQARTYMNKLLPTLDYWKHYEELSDNGQFEAFKKQLIDEINTLQIGGMPKLEKLNALVGGNENSKYHFPMV